MFGDRRDAAPPPAAGAGPAADAASPRPGAAASPAAAPGDAEAALREKVIDVLRTCFDPEIPVNIYELGLIYDLRVDPGGAVQIRMTLTSPMCPVAGSLPPEVESKVNAIPGVSSAQVELVWDPPWTPERMTEAARLQLNIF